MLQIMNPRSIRISDSGGSSTTNIGIVTNYWENARPLIRELEQTVDFAERKYGDLIQQLNLCKEYYEKWSAERCSHQLHKRKIEKKCCRKYQTTRSSSEDESEKMEIQQMCYNSDEKLNKRLYEIKNEMRESNRKIILKECAWDVEKEGMETVNNSPPLIMEMGESKIKEENNDDQEGGVHVSCDLVSKSEAKMQMKKEKKNSLYDRKEFDQSIKKTSNRTLTKKKSQLLVKYTKMQRYKIRSKSLPQGVRRKFGFGSFVEIIDRQRSKLNENLVNVKSRMTVSSGSKSNVNKRGGAKTKSKTKFSNRKYRGTGNYIPTITNVNVLGDGKNFPKWTPAKPKIDSSLTRSESAYQSIGSCSNVMKFSPSFLTAGNDGKSLKTENATNGKQRSLILASRQSIPFTICRSMKTFNLGLNIQQVLSMIKSKKHSAMLQAIINDNMGGAHCIMRKTDPGINALFISASGRLGKTASEVCPARDDGDHSYSVITRSSESRLKCNMLTCINQSGTPSPHNLTETMTNPGSMSLMRHIEFGEVRRPEDVWAVEQPGLEHNSEQGLQRYRTRCTCFPTKNSADYNKVLKQYSRMQHCERKSLAENSLSPTTFSSQFVLPELYSLPSQDRINYNDKIIGFKIHIKKVLDDLDNLSRRFRTLQEQLLGHNEDDETDAKLDALELELSHREEDCKSVMNCYNELIILKKRIKEMRDRVKSSANMSEVAQKPGKLKKDPLRPTPSMTLTRVLRQIQCLQDKIKLFDSSSNT